jgi:hypothetical protein
MQLLSNIWVIITTRRRRSGLSNATRGLSPSTQTILKAEMHFVIFWTRLERRPWSSLSALKPLKNHQEPFGLSGDWVTFTSTIIDALKLFILFSMPFEVFPPLLICGKYVPLPHPVFFFLFSLPAIPYHYI